MSGLNSTEQDSIIIKNLEKIRRNIKEIIEMELRGLSISSRKSIVRSTINYLLDAY